MTLELLPLSQGELRGRKEDFIKTVFDAEELPDPLKPISHRELYELIITGGYPSVQDESTDLQRKWFINYIDSMIVKDVQLISNVDDITQLPLYLQMIALQAGQLINMDSLSNKLDLSASIIKKYTAIFQSLFIIQFSKAWTLSIEKRLVKTPRVYFVDTGLLCRYANITTERLLTEQPLTGPLLENFVWSELTKQATWSELEVKIYHFRTTKGKEVDIVLED